jgi:hypothetical protein
LNNYVHFNKSEIEENINHISEKYLKNTMDKGGVVTANYVSYSQELSLDDLEFQEFKINETVQKC